ncbi:MAG: hypothetical protein Q9170_007131 [Blastenia crenularia]
MNFGYSAGDFLATARLISDIISALRSSSVSEFRELTSELVNVQRALYEIEHIQPPAGQETVVNGIKIAALLCKHPLDEFMVRIRRYETLGQVGLGRKEQVKRWKLKLQWGLTMEEEVQRIRTVLSVHMASLSVRLGAQGMASHFTTSQGLHAVHERLIDTQNAILDIRRDNELQKDAVREGNSFLQNIIRTLQDGVLPQITILLNIACKIWESNIQILNLLFQLQDATLIPDLNHTHFQPPCIFEDALGRILQVPAEYDIGLLKAIISARFATGPGSEQVPAGEYELFNTSDTTQLLSESQSQALIPGMRITMAFIIGFYDTRPLKVCPRPGCQARTFAKVKAGGQSCSACSVWFDVSREQLPRPFRLGSVENVFQRLRAQRKWFKNVKICRTEIPRIPPTSDHLGMWVKMGGNQIPTQVTLTEADDRLRLENLQNSIIPFEKSSGETSTQNKLEAVAAQAIREISEEVGIPVEELKDLAFNDFEPGTLGIDSLLSLSIIMRLECLGINLPKPCPAKSSYVHGLYLESFVKDFVKEYWYCLKDECILSAESYC